MIKFNKAGYTWARKLIFAGQLNKESDWLFESKDQEKLFEMSNKKWSDYGRWFLGVDDSYEENNFSHWVYPVGKDGEIIQRGIIATKSQSGQIGDSEVNDHADKLLKTIDENKALFTLNDDNEILIYGIIYGDDVESIISKIRQVSKTQEEINVRLNSPGGSYTAGLAVYNYVKSLGKKVNFIIDGEASSAVSLLACSGHVIMFASAITLAHNPWTIAGGDYRDFTHYARDLDTLAKSAASAYAYKTGMSLSDVRSLMDEGAYLTAQEAYDIGLCDEIVHEAVYMSKTKFFGGNLMEIKNVLAGLKLPNDDKTVQTLMDAVESDIKAENETLKDKVMALSKTSMVAKLTGRIGDGPAKMMGKVSDQLPVENFEEIVSFIEGLQAAVADLGGPKGKNSEPKGTTDDEVINAEVDKIMKAEGITDWNDALTMLAERNPQLVANWR